MSEQGREKCEKRTLRLGQLYWIDAFTSITPMAIEKRKVTLRIDRQRVERTLGGLHLNGDVETATIELDMQGAGDSP